jgi:ABC-type molybdate transport system substrate-binding protein
LQAKALQLVGGPNSKPLVQGHGAGAGIFLADRADAMPVYCSGAAALLQEVPGLVAIELPPELAVHPVEGLIALSDNPVATKFALFILSETGQAIMTRHGFQPIGRASE